MASVDDCVMHKHTRGGCAKWFLSCSAGITSIQGRERANHLVGKYSSIFLSKVPGIYFARATLSVGQVSQEVDGFE